MYNVGLDTRKHRLLRCSMSAAAAVSDHISESVHLLQSLAIQAGHSASPAFAAVLLRIQDDLKASLSAQHSLVSMQAFMLWLFQGVT